MLRIFADLGVLRTLLALATVLVIAAAPFAGEVIYEDWRFLPTAVAPTLMALLVFVLPLDLTMTRVFMLDLEGEPRRRLGRVLVIEALLYVLLILAWLPFIGSMLGAEAPL